MRRIMTGKLGESLAVVHLQKMGYQIVAQNYRCLYGEVDVVARDGDTLVFVEVKSRKSGTFGAPQEAVGLEKQKKLSRVSLHYLQQKRLETCKARFDVIAVRMSPDGTRIDLIQNAFNLIL
ncbi:MAG: YraN family protein [Syntrophales bacterium]|nr:YraN family protein [Syntrophales bacterium]PKN59823.1 MAG: YraN family protein [Deltaproteobacteria bacterium HGW-Deltaproteobacteria-11]